MYTCPGVRLMSHLQGFVCFQVAKSAYIEMSVADSDAEPQDERISVISVSLCLTGWDLWGCWKTESSRRKEKLKGSKRLSARLEQVSWWITEHTFTANIYLFTQKSSSHHSWRCVCVYCMQHTAVVIPPQRRREVEEWQRRWNLMLEMMSERETEGGERWKGRGERGDDYAV